MKLIKYFALALVLIAGQAMAGPHYGQQSSAWQIRIDAQAMLASERSLLSSINYYGSAYSHLARDVRVLMHKTIRMRNMAHSGASPHELRIQMRNIRIQFNHMRRAIARSHRVHHARAVQRRLSHVRHKMNRMSNNVYAYGRYRRHVYWR